jgi:hypothetical protein
MAHAHCMLDTKDYKHKLRICNNYLRFHNNNGCSNPPHCYVIRTLPVMCLIIMYTWYGWLYILINTAGYRIIFFFCTFKLFIWLAVTKYQGGRVSLCKYVYTWVLCGNTGVQADSATQWISCMFERGWKRTEETACPKFLFETYLIRS